MNKLLLIPVLLMLANCTLPKNPKVEFGKKCIADGQQVTYSYVWKYDKSLGSKPSVEQCEQLAD